MGKNIWRNGDVISGAVLAALGTFIFLQSRAWDYYTIDGPGPAFFPAWYGVIMIALSLVLIVSAIRKNEASGSIDWQATGRALAAWAAFALSIALMDVLGFVLSFTLLTFFIVMYIFRRPMMTAAITAVCCALGFYLVFPVALSLQLPTGLFGF
jgi:hypothetical protein